jgi:hypothetical protein
MKTLKIVVVLTLAVVAAALLIATAYAYTGGVVANSVPRGTASGGYYGGMMGDGGMMRGYYASAPAGTAPTQSGEPSTTTPATPSSQYPIGGWGCIGMRRGLP